MNKLIFVVLSFFLTLPLSGGTMLRVLRVGDHATLVVQGKGGESVLHLAGIEITDAAGAQELLRWSVGTSWVMVEAEPQQGQGFVYIYRSPDALFLNRELVNRGYARATLPTVAPQSYVPVTYLGELNPPAIRPATRTPKPATSATQSRTGKGTSRRSKASPARRGRSTADSGG
jgi:hypothetical protein